MIDFKKLDNNDLSNIEQSTQQLEILKNDLRNITQERMMMDVLNRQAFNLNRYHAKATEDYPKLRSKSYSIGGNNHGPVEFSNKLMRPAPQTNASYNNSTSTYRKLSTRKNETSQMQQKIKGSLLTDFIEIPTYDISVAENSKDFECKTVNKPIVRVRSVVREGNNQLVVPSLRQGPLPPELSELKTIKKIKIK